MNTGAKETGEDRHYDYWLVLCARKWIAIEEFRRPVVGVYKSMAKRNWLGCCFIVLAGLCCASFLLADDTLPTGNRVKSEIDIVAYAHNAAKTRDASVIVSILQKQIASGDSPSAVLARRCVMLCGWLQNETEDALATLIATQALTVLGKQKETNDGDLEL